MPEERLMAALRKQVRLAATVFALSCSLGCSPPDTTGIALIGHGGLGPNEHRPMNSQQALLAALDAGLAGVELDVQLTRDSVLVAHHDLVVTGKGCSGRVHDLRWADLAACTDTAGPEGSFRGVRLDAFLREALEKHPQAEFTLDVKLNTATEWWPYLRTFSEAIGRLHRTLHAAKPVLVECKTPDLLLAMKQFAPEVPTFLYVDNATDALAQARHLGCAGITIQTDRISAEEAERIRAGGLQLTLFGVGSSWALRSATRKKPQRIQVDQ